MLSKDGSNHVHGRVKMEMAQSARWPEQLGERKNGGMAIVDEIPKSGNHASIAAKVCFELALAGRRPEHLERLQDAEVGFGFTGDSAGANGHGSCFCCAALQVG